jgi:hypothetical protein
MIPEIPFLYLIIGIVTGLLSFSFGLLVLGSIEPGRVPEPDLSQGETHR